MKFQSRSLPADDAFRPQPSFYQSEDGKTLAVITNWGNAAATNLVVERIKAALSPTLIDGDETRVISGAAKKEAPIEVKLAESIRAANMDIYNTENRAAWKTVVEVTALHIHNGIAYWAQAGFPHLLLSSPPSRQIEFLSVSPDSSAISSSPLPMSGIGLDEFPNVTSGSIQTVPGASLALVCLPSSALSLLGKNKLSVEGVLTSVSKVKSPIWVGIVEIEN